MTALEEIIRKQIRATGPLTLAEYMTLCLAHPEHGYYRNRDPLGEAGDFTTAPEISQMFGEMIGLWLASVWQGGPFVLAEIGPGRGTLMADILRATSKVEGFLDAGRICQVETSPVLMARQQEALLGYEVEWFESILDVPDGQLLLVANEFFDVLPVRQFFRGGSSWQERMVGLDGDTLGFGLAPVTDLKIQDQPEGSIVEICAAGEAIASELGRRIKGQGGAALIIDYGGWDGTGDTFQAVEQQKYADPFGNPGEADLTAHVRFKALADASDVCSQFTTQGAFLKALGIEMRAQALSQGARADSIERDLKRLTDPVEMGELFKVLALFPEGVAQPPGFD